MSTENKAKKSLGSKLLIVGLIAIVLSLAALVVCGLTNMIPWDNADNAYNANWGIKAATGWFWGSFVTDPGWAGGGRTVRGSENIWRFLAVVMVYAGGSLSLAGIIASLAMKQPKKILNFLVVMFGVFYLSYLVVSIAVPLALFDTVIMWDCAYFGYMIVTIIAVFGFILAIASCVVEAKAVVAAKKAEKEAEEKKEEPVEEKAAGLSEEEVKAIVEKYLAKHVDDKHKENAPVAAKVEEKKEPEPEPKKEPEPEPVKEEKKEEEVKAEVAGENDPFAGLGSRRRRASFETRLKNSEYDLRHKYYDLRDYIKSYGVKNRISIPGDTFSAHREKYVFITIVGKHIKAYFALNPADYAESTIPVSHNTAKKYEDLPLEIKIKSDLSFRRACKLVDDLMAKKGMTKVEEKGE